LKKNILIAILNLIAASGLLFIGVSNYFKGITYTSYLFIIAGILCIVGGILSIVGSHTKKRNTSSQNDNSQKNIFSS
jgi:predicted phage tail protein